MQAFSVFFGLISNAECKGAPSEAEENDGANEPEISLLDDILSVEAGGSTSTLDKNHDGGAQQQQEVTFLDLKISCFFCAVCLFCCWLGGSFFF